MTGVGISTAPPTAIDPRRAGAPPADCPRSRAMRAPASRQKPRVTAPAARSTSAVLHPGLVRRRERPDLRAPVSQHLEPRIRVSAFSRRATRDVRRHRGRVDRQPTAADGGRDEVVRQADRDAQCSYFDHTVRRASGTTFDASSGSGRRRRRRMSSSCAVDLGLVGQRRVVDDTCGSAGMMTSLAHLVVLHPDREQLLVVPPAADERSPLRTWSKVNVLESRVTRPLGRPPSGSGR